MTNLHDILEKRIDENENIFDYKEDPINYQFITSWAALNKNSLKTFRKMKPENRINYLNKLLEKNIAFISNELNLDPPEKLISMIKINSTEPMLIDNRKWGSFDGKFKTNFHLPSFVGLGNGITRGFGTLFNENYCKAFNREFLGLNESEENKYFESDYDEICSDDFKKLNTINRRMFIFSAAKAVVLFGIVGGSGRPQRILKIQNQDIPLTLILNYIIKNSTRFNLC